MADQKVPVETNVLYTYPQEVCYGVLKEHVLGAINIAASATWLRIPTATVNLAVIEDDWRAYKIIAKVQYQVLGGLVEYTIGPPIKIYSRSTGVDTCVVEIVADSASFYDGTFLNSLADFLTKEVPIYSGLTRLIIPNAYWDDVLVLDRGKMESQSYQAEIGRTAYKYLFSKCQRILGEKLSELYG
jgi:hypothetical protein